MNSITKPDHLDNLGGIIKLWYIPVEDVSSISRPIHDFGGITLAANKQWLEFYFSPQSAKYDVKFKTGPKGSYFECMITGIYPKQNAANNYLINQLRDAAFVCKVLDANGVYRIVGTPDFPLKFTFDFDSGSKTADRNSIGFLFSGKSKYAPIFLTSEQGQQANPT